MQIIGNNIAFWEKNSTCNKCNLNWKVCTAQPRYYWVNNVDVCVSIFSIIFRKSQAGNFQTSQSEERLP